MMTFQELRTKTSNLYPAYIPDDLQQTINDWFDNREVCDDDNFVRFFQRVLNRDYVRYTELLRVEPGISKYDWLVTAYRERSTWGNDGEQSKENKDVTPGVTDTVTTQENGGDYVETIEKTDNSTRTPKNLTTQTTERSTPLAGSTKIIDNVNVAKSNPYSIEYANAVAGKIPDLAWGTAGQQAQSRNTETFKPDGETDTRESSVILNGEESIKAGGTETKKATGSKTRTMTSTRTGKDNEVSNREKNGNFENYEIYTGRDASIPELLNSAVSYIKSTSAWAWLQWRLETCFMGVYDV